MGITVILGGVVTGGSRLIHPSTGRQINGRVGSTASYPSVKFVKVEETPQDYSRFKDMAICILSN